MAFKDNENNDPEIHQNDEVIHLTELDEEGLEQFKEALARSDHNKLEEIYEQYQPIDFAQEMEDFEDEEIAQTCALLDDEELGEILEQADEKLQNTVIRFIDNNDAIPAMTAHGTQHH